MKQNIEQFVQETDDITSILKRTMLIEPIDNEQTLAYLHSSVSRNWHYIRYPQTPLFLDHILPDETLDIGLTLKLGDEYIPIIGVNDFPQATYPAIFDNLNKAELEYRWVTRYLCMDKEEALKFASKTGKNHRGNKTSELDSFISSMKKEPPTHINRGAVLKEDDTDEAEAEIETDQIGLGYYTSSVMVWDKDLSKAKKKSTKVKAIIQSAGFTCKEETFNAFEAFKGMMAGHVYSNVRRLPVATDTLSHVVPVSAIWSGFLTNEFAGGKSGCYTPHLVCSTGYGTPFFLNLNISSVGHTAIWGPTGAGKSTLLNLLEMQFLKYPNSQVVILDKDRSARQSTMAVGGRYYEPGAGTVSFQPLADLDTDEQCVWACEFIETLLTLQNLIVTPKIGTAVADAIHQMRDVPREQRTVTTFCQTCNYLDAQTKQSVITETLSPYRLGGKYGNIFDSGQTSVVLSRWTMIEMGRLMSMGEACVAGALTYLFRFIDRTFDPAKLTMLVLDEAWLFLKHPIFQDKITEWLKTLRKKSVFVVFATQELADAVKSPLASTIIEQCHTQIFLANPAGSTTSVARYYQTFGLSDAEISIISNAVMQRDYFYKSAAGTRLFQLNLGEVTKALICDPDHEVLDELEKQHKEDPEYEYAEDILKSKGIDYSHYM